MTIPKSISRRRRPSAPVLAEHGMNPDETRHLHRAIGTVVANLSPKQLELRAEDLIKYLQHRKQILELPEKLFENVEPKAETLLNIVANLTAEPPTQTKLDRRLGWLAKSMRLSPVERAVLTVMARRAVFASWADLMDLLPFRAITPNVAAISAITGYSLSAIDRCLAPGSPLLRAGLLRDDHDGEFDSTNLLKRIAMSHARKPADLMCWLVPTAPASALEWSDFEHLGSARDLALQAMRGGAPLSLLLYGEPGTGKTEFARLLAAKIGREAVFAGLEDAKGREPTRTERFDHLSLLKALCKHDRRHVLVMDEADDVLLMSGRRDASKLWVNRAVENPELPTIWILNDPTMLDPAVARRMNLAIGFERPPLPVRQRIIGKVAEREGIILSAADQRQLARIPASPAQIANGLAVARLASGGIGEAQQAIKGVLTAMGQTKAQDEPEHTVYDPRWSTAQMDLDDLSQRLRGGADKGWSLLLFGPSGTGKSAYARHLAQQLGLEIEERRGSDLLGPHVGETEARIAAAFAQAEARKAMLLIDEADSFLFRRDGARKSWEISLVNEMLRQMEHRRWPFVATTNLVDQLDPAVQRRFTMRIGFGAMKDAQVKELFAAHFAQDWPGTRSVPDGLTLGDLAVVAQRARLLNEADPHRLVEWLQSEADARCSNRRPAGFAIPAPSITNKETR